MLERSIIRPDQLAGVILPLHGLAAPGDGRRQRLESRLLLHETQKTIRLWGASSSSGKFGNIFLSIGTDRAKIKHLKLNVKFEP